MSQETQLLPHMTLELARRIEQNDLDYSLSRLEGMRQAAGNPLGIEVRRFGRATAFLIEAWPDFWYGNKVLGLEPASVNDAAEIVEFFQRRNLSFRIEIAPAHLDSALGTRLHQLGLCQMGFNTAVYGRPYIPAGSPRHRSVSVRDIGADEWDLWLDVYQAGFELPRLKDDERRAVRAWLQSAQNSLSLCLAQVDSAPAGVGVLYMHEGVGLLADAATLPAFRGRGCHAALLQHRIAQAHSQGCDLLTSFVEFGSASHRNLERAGLRVAYTKAMWWPAVLG